MSRYRVVLDGSTGKLMGVYDDLELATRDARIFAFARQRIVSIFEGGVLIGEVSPST